MLLVCPCVRLSAAFTFSNCVTNCYKSDVNIMMALQGTTTQEALIADTW